MIKIYVKKYGDYPVGALGLKTRLRKFLEGKGIVSDSIVNICLVGKKRMVDIGKKYLKDNEVHNVLTFVDSEVQKEFKYPSGEVNYLGEIIVCYPVAVEEAKSENKLIEEKVYELVEHGARHLLGEHHE